MAKFEKVSKYKDVDLPLPHRATSASAGYDFVVAEDTVIPPYDFFRTKIQDNAFENNRHEDYYGFINPYSLDEFAAATKELKAKVTLVPTGMKCKMAKNQYLQLYIRSSTPLKHWLILGNGCAVIDSDYYNSSENEGHIFFQIINLSPFAIELHRGEVIGQGVIQTYDIVEDDAAEGERLGGFGSTSNG